jgi:hypothetical protein
MFEICAKKNVGFHGKYPLLNKTKYVDQLLQNSPLI